MRPKSDQRALDEESKPRKNGYELYPFISIPFGLLKSWQNLVSFTEPTHYNEVYTN